MFVFYISCSVQDIVVLDQLSELMGPKTKLWCPMPLGSKGSDTDRHKKRRVKTRWEWQQGQLVCRHTVVEVAQPI